MTTVATPPDADGWCSLSLHAGDLINNADNDEEWAHWFAGSGALAHGKLVIASPGNHEYSGDQLLQQYKGHFEMPGNGPAFHREDVWFCDYQGVRFISLNANAPLGIFSFRGVALSRSAVCTNAPLTAEG